LPTPTPTPAFTVGTTPTARGYHQLVGVGGETLLLGGYTLNDITAAEHGIPEADREHPGRTPDAVWSFRSSAGWTYAGPPDRVFLTNQIDEAVQLPSTGLVLMHLASHQEPSSRLFDPKSGALTNTDDGGGDVFGPFMAYDSGSDRVIVFGGLFSDTTWAYDPAAGVWTRMSPAVRPSQRNYGAMAYDPVSDRIILFGGGTETENYGDTWAYDYEADAWIELTTGKAPPARSYTSMVYDPVGRRMILFGGLDDVDPCDQGEGWTHDGAFPEWDHTLADTWAYDPATNTWSDLAPASAPSPRGWHDMVYEAETGLVVLFGGGPARGAFTAETWLYDTAANSWSEWSSP
jgi:hypothetical protein